MNKARAWIAGKLSEEGLSTTNAGSDALIIQRHGLPDACVYCVGVSPGEIFGANAVDAAIKAMPDLQFIVVLPTSQIGNDAYQRAEERGICVAGFGELSSALQDDVDIAQHIDTQEQYERRRLARNPTVESLKRRGQHAYEIHRYGLRPLTIVTTNVYEFTADELYDLLDLYSGVEPDLIVVTNPNCTGLSTDSQRASMQTGIGLVLFPQLLNNLGKKWT